MCQFRVLYREYLNFPNKVFQHRRSRKGNANTLLTDSPSQLAPLRDPLVSFHMTCTFPGNGQLPLDCQIEMYMMTKLTREKHFFFQVKCKINLIQTI